MMKIKSKKRQIKKIKSLTTKSTKPKRETTIKIGKVKKKQANSIKSQLGIEVKGFTRKISTSSIAHIIKRHGNKKIEADRGQIAVTFKDFDLVPIIVFNPDKVSIGKELNTIKYEKQIGNRYIVIEILRSTKMKLDLKTMYIKKAN